MLPANSATEICFRVTEPCTLTFVPKVSEPKLGQVEQIDFDTYPGDVVLTIQLRDDFKLSDQEADEQLMMAFPDNKYLGEGQYRLNLGDIAGFYVRVNEKPRHEAILQTLADAQKNYEITYKTPQVDQQQPGVSQSLGQKNQK